jgi:signal transduction histidine kinase
MPEGGELKIESKKSNNAIQIIFTDTGTGIPESVRDKLWTPLATTKAKGMGLGLAICKRIIEAHAGSISVESTVGKGTSFTVTLPIKPRVNEVSK